MVNSTTIRAATTPVRVSENDFMPITGTRDGAIWVVDRLQALILEGRGFSLQFGTEDAPIDLTVAIDPILVTALVDIPAGTTAILIFAQGVVATWSDATLLNFMLEIDRGKTRFSSAGTAYTPLNLRTDTPIASLATGRVGPDVVAAAKSVGGSLEIYRESIEVNVGNVADYNPPMRYEPDKPEMVVGPASMIVHFGGANGGTDATGYGSLQWIEIPTTSIKG